VNDVVVELDVSSNLHWNFIVKVFNSTVTLEPEIIRSNSHLQPVIN
jgi:hypothetical protein